MPKLQAFSPSSAQALLTRAQSLAGQNLADLAHTMDIPLPETNTKAKGWAGMILERALGATAGNQTGPDFPELGIELKTLPIDVTGKPFESTFVSSIPLMDIGNETWETSTVYQKLRQVLWVPLLWEKKAPVQTREVCTPILWSPNAVEYAQLKADWVELTNMICLGEIERIGGRLGHWLHIRPKGATSRDLVPAIDSDGNGFMTLPRGFYLRAQFTQYLLNTYFHAG